jgi:hypothetical protein
MEVVSCHLPNVGADSTFSGTSLGAGAIAPCVALGFTVVGLVLGFKSKAWNKFLLPQVGGISILHSLELREGSCGQLFPSCLCLAGCLVSWLVGWLVGWFSVLFFKTGFHHVAQTGLKLMILLPHLPKCWY